MIIKIEYNQSNELKGLYINYSEIFPEMIEKFIIVPRENPNNEFYVIGLTIITIKDGIEFDMIEIDRATNRVFMWTVGGKHVNGIYKDEDENITIKDGITIYETIVLMER